MAEALYLDDMLMREFEAEVLSVSEGKYVVLDRTAFFPKSGGVSYDTGLLQRGDEDFQVVYVGKFGGKISHEVDRAGLQSGDMVKGILDWDRRYTLMRYHTAAHVLSGAFYRNLGAKITGNDLEVDKGRIDFNLSDFDRRLIEEQVGVCNEIVQKNFPVEVYYMDRSELENDPDMTKLAMGLPKGIKTVRIVDIKGFDRQPDGGCHVKSLKEIGVITLTKLVNKGKNNRRLYFILE